MGPFALTVKVRGFLEALDHYASALLRIHLRRLLRGACLELLRLLLRSASAATTAT